MIVKQIPHTAESAFSDFVLATEPGLQRALVAGYGPDAGREATVDALVYAWRHWPRVRELDNPGGYLYRVGRSRARRKVWKRPTARHTEAGFQLGEGGGESPQVGGGGCGSDVDIPGRRHRHIVQLDGEPADHHIVDPVMLQHRQHAVGIDVGRRHLFPDAPKPGLGGTLLPSRFDVGPLRRWKG